MMDNLGLLAIAGIIYLIWQDVKKAAENLTGCDPNCSGFNKWIGLCKVCSAMETGDLRTGTLSVPKNIPGVYDFVGTDGNFYSGDGTTAYQYVISSKGEVIYTGVKVPQATVDPELQLIPIPPLIAPSPYGHA
jgi:hypothetical protein